MRYNLLMTDEFEQWLHHEPAKSRFQIAKRLENIKESGQSKDINQAEKIYSDWVYD